MKKIYSAGIVVYRETEQGIVYLLLRHSAGGHWDFPKGKIEQGETGRQAALRELQEETGIAGVTITDDFFETIMYDFTDYDDTPAHKTVQYILGLTVQKNIHLSDEHDAYMWMSFKDAHEQLTYANAKQVLVKSDEHIRLS